jgi:hypothetical protein
MESNRSEQPMRYFRVNNFEECHKGFQYRTGLNVLRDKFNDDPTASCVAGGLYFTDIDHIHKFIAYREDSFWLREVFLPKDDPNFKMVKDPEGDKYRANSFILGKRYLLFDMNTFAMLSEYGCLFSKDAGWRIYYYSFVNSRLHHYVEDPNNITNEARYVLENHSEIFKNAEIQKRCQSSGYLYNVISVYKSFADEQRRQRKYDAGVGAMIGAILVAGLFSFFIKG